MTETAEWVMAVAMLLLLIFGGWWICKGTGDKHWDV